MDNFYFLIDLAFVWWLLLALIQVAADGTEMAEAAEDRRADVDGRPVAAVRGAVRRGKVGRK